MGIFYQAAYSGVFKYFCLPVFFLMLIGRPRFLINLVHKLISIRDPFLQLRIFRFTFVICLITTIWSYYRKVTLEHLVEEISKGSEKGTNMLYIDEKIREAHLHERNTYMFFTIIIMMIVVEKFCHSYFKLWALEDASKLKRNSKIIEGKPNVDDKQLNDNTKDQKLKKND